tara:strand:+ start:353 stop:820 length:468 start_codon:yes stop_codon:yes gene_type:complete
MITYKDLRENLNAITEGEETVGGAARSAHSDYGIHRIENPEQHGRLNSFINSFTNKEFIEPKAAMAQLRHKFNLAGLDFKWDNTSTFDEGNATLLPLSRYGGTFGTTPEHDLSTGFQVTDGIAEFNNGVSLSLSVNTHPGKNGLMKLDAEIVPSA